MTKQTKMMLMVATVTTLFWMTTAMSLVDVNCPKSCDCSHVTNPGKDHLQITCFVWDLSEFDFHALLLVSENYHLKLFCDSDVPIELTRGVFAVLEQMTSISLNNCKLSYVGEDVFEGLGDLAEVEIHAATNLNLRIHPDAFKSLKQLEHLSLCSNGLREIPDLCRFKHLKSVNLSGNALEKLEDTGLACVENNTMRQLTRLDLSNNFISSIGAFEGYGQAFQNLEMFFIENNDVTLTSSDRPFVNFPQLRTLDLSGNQLSALPDTLIEGNYQLQELDLSGNQLESIPGNLLRYSNILLRLDVSHNKLNDTIWTTFVTTNNLMILDLSHNQLRSVNTRVIEELTELAHLNLGHNNIFTIKPRTFQNQQRLKTLVLAGNDFHLIDNEVFYGLFMLYKLELQDNQLYGMNRNLLSSLTSLTHLNLSTNYLTELPSLLKLTSLLSFDASNNILGELDETLFQAQKNIQYINVSRNKISHVSEMLFKSCEALETLDLSVNVIQYIHPAIFMDLAVQRLFLQQNKIEDVGKTFANMKQLRELNLSNNNIRDIIQRYMFPEPLEMLDLSYNNIQHVRQRAFYGLKQIRMIDIGFNKINTLPEDAMMVSNGPYSQSAFVIKGNPLVCDCNLLWLRNWVQSLKGPVIVGLNETVCTGAFEFPKSTIHVVPPDRFLCKYDTLCTKKCLCCDYFACDCKYTCPSKCDCYRGADVTDIHYLQCSERNITGIDKFLPKTATRLDLSGNDIGRVQSHTFIGMHLLKRLYLNNSLISDLENRSFVGLKKLVTLHLEYNFVKTLRKSMFEGLDSVKELHLDHNQISYIEPGVFDNMKDLQVVRLSHNFLQQMDDYTAHLVFKFQDITLYSNPWACDCSMYFSARHNPSAFLNASDAIHAHSVRINCAVHSFNNINKLTHLDEYRTICEGSDLHEDNSYIKSLRSDSKTGPYRADQGGGNSSVPRGKESDTDVRSEILGLQIPDKHLKVLLPITVVSLLIVLLAMMVMFKTGITKCWFCASSRCKARDDDILYDKTRHIDAFIAYHPRDEAYVIRELALRLERGNPKYQLLVQHRDFPAGSSMHHFIENGVRYSHRTIIVLSNDHVYDNTWLKYVLECVKQDSLRRLILVVLGKVDKEAIDPIIQTRMKTEYSIKNGDRWFWEKMVFCLPQPGKTERDNARAEVRPYASTDLARLSKTVRDNQAYEEPLSTLSRSMSSRPLPTITEYVPSSTSSYVYTAGSQSSSNIYEEIHDKEGASSKIPANYEEPWKEAELEEHFSTLSRESEDKCSTLSRDSTRPLCSA